MLAMQTMKTERKTPSIVVVGIGNEYQRDNAAGLLVARAVRKQISHKLDDGKVSIVECTGGSFELVDSWHGAAVVILVDAVSSGAGPGTVFRIEAPRQPVPSHLFHYSAHGFNVAHMIELARLLGKLPPRVVVFGIEGADFGHGQGVSDDIALAVERVASSVLVYVCDCIEGNQ